MSTADIDRVITARKSLHFLSGMLLAWDLDYVEIGEEEKDGLWFMLDCIKKELEHIDICPPTTGNNCTTN